jgi:AhpD family alkylhydroperoxidase
MYDAKHMSKLKKYNELTPEAMKAFKDWNAAVFKDGALAHKVKELMAVAVAVTTQCVYCIDVHTKKAKEAGATEQELAEATMVSAALRAGGSLTHGLHCLE